MFNRLLKNKSGNIFIQVFRYCISGGLAFVVDFVVLYLLTTIVGWHYLYGTALGYLIGLVITYFLSITWVFDSRKISNHWLEFLGFTMIGLWGMGLTQLFMWLLTDYLFQNESMYLYSKLITIFFVSGIIFIFKKLFLFSNANATWKNNVLNFLSIRKR